MARRDLTGAVDFSVLERVTGGDHDTAEEVLGLFVEQAAVWTPLLSAESEGWRDAAHTLRGAAAGIGAHGVAQACAHAEAGDAHGAPARLAAVRDALDAALADVAAWRHEQALRSLKGR